MVQTTQFIAKFALLFILAATCILTVVLTFAGIEPVRAAFHSVCLSITAFMTGGFTPMSQSVVYYHSFPLEVVLMLLMMAGSISFTLHAELRKGRIGAFFRDIEVRTLIIWLAVATCVMAASLSVSTTSPRSAARRRRRASFSASLLMPKPPVSTTAASNICKSVFLS